MKKFDIIKKLEENEMNIHNEINEDIKFLAKSEIRLKILSELQNYPNNVHGLVKETKITYSSVSSNISKLEQRNHITKINNNYHINSMASIYFKTLMDFKTSVDLIRDYDDFWNRHDLNQISIDCLKSITDLKGSQLIETTPIDIYKTHNTIKNQLMKTKSLKAVFPYLHPEYPKLIENILKKGSVEIIIPKSIYHAIKSKMDTKILKNAYKNKKLKIHPIDDDLKVYLTVCDESMSLGLFKDDGSFDQNRIMICENEKSKKWAENLFETIKSDVIK